MHLKQLANHIAYKLHGGYPLDEITSELLLEGWTQKEVDRAYTLCLNPEKVDRFSLREFLRTEVPLRFTLASFAVIVIIFSGAFFVFKGKSNTYTITLPEIPTAQALEFDYGEQPALANPQFFQKVKQQFISSKAAFVEVDLTAKVARAYRDGEVALEIPVQTIGREGSWWETPAGLYKINTKEANHFSGMGHVYMPWSMNFQGNFYIHGWPYYPDGKEVSSTYSGGCIRLSTEDAKKLYDVVDVGEPILVFKEAFNADDFSYKTAAPKLSAGAFITADLRNNFVFMKNESTSTLPIASITKLMTALVATEYINLDAKASVPSSALVYTSVPRLKPGQEISIYQLLFPLLMESSNEAAETIARFYGRDVFIKRMNDKAKSLGMTNTVFTDPSGADKGNVSTPEDLFMLAKYIYHNRSFILNITSGKIKNSAYGPSQFSNLANFNSFVGNPLYVGGKVGQTIAAGETELAVFEISFNGVKRPVMTVVLGSKDSKKDTTTVLNYLTRSFTVE